MSFIPENYQDLFNENCKALLYLATINTDGSPQVTPVWFSTDGEYILINTNEGRTKDRNMKARPRVSMAIQDPADFYRYIMIHGIVESRSSEGADEHINMLAIKYGDEPWEKRAGEKRIIFKIKPTRVDPH